MLSSETEDALRADIQRLRAKLEEQGRGIAIVQTQAAKYGRERDEERKVNDAIAAHARAAEKEADTRAAESFRTGWHKGAEATREAGMTAARREFLRCINENPVPQPSNFGWRVVLAAERYPLPPCPEGPPAPKPTDAGTGAVTSGEATPPISAIERAHQRVPLWDAINRVVAASGGNAGNTSVARQKAVVEVERAVDALQAEAIKAAVASERERCLAWAMDCSVMWAATVQGIASGADAPGAGK